jgi:hypothetical protein
MISGIYLKNGQILISSKLEKISPEDYNDPDIVVENPYEVFSVLGKPECLDIGRYLSLYTEQSSFSFHSEDILTAFKPNSELCKKYVIANGMDEQLELQFTANNEEGEEEGI